MISVTDLRSGSAYIEDGQILKVIKYEHIKMGRGSANIKVKVKNLRTGSITERSFISGARVQEADLVKKEVQYLYSQNNTYTFMDPQNFEQYSVGGKLLGEDVKFLREGMNINLLLYGEEALSIELPIKMEFTVKETDPGVRGNSATNLYKDAVLENDIHVKIPLFVQEGDKVRIDTRDCEYIERVGK